VKSRPALTRISPTIRLFQGGELCFRRGEEGEGKKKKKKNEGRDSGCSRARFHFFEYGLLLLKCRRGAVVKKRRGKGREKEGKRTFGSGIPILSNLFFYLGGTEEKREEKGGGRRPHK